MSEHSVISAGNVATVLWVLCSVARGAMAQESDCYGPGSIAGAVIGTLVVVAIILGLVYLVYKHLWKPRRGEEYFTSLQKNRITISSYR